jgi:putative phosphoribosyl transferase
VGKYMFQDRTDAGKKLAEVLQAYKDKNTLVLAIPKGGIEVGYQVAKALNADFSIIIARKLPYPDNPEAGFGAIAEDGSTFIFEEEKDWFAPEIIDRIIEGQKQEIVRRITILRQDMPLPEITGKIVILVDDGIAMGSTMRASIMLCKNRRAGKIVVAAPVAGQSVVTELSKLVDDVVVVETPPFFRAVAQVYRNWYDVSDQEALEILERWPII